MVFLFVALLAGLNTDKSDWCKLDFDYLRYGTIETIDVYLAGPPEQRFEIKSPKRISTFVDHFVALGPITTYGNPENADIIGFIRFPPHGRDPILITESSVAVHRCHRLLTEIEHQELMQMLLASKGEG